MGKHTKNWKSNADTNPGHDKYLMICFYFVHLSL